MALGSIARRGDALRCRRARGKDTGMVLHDAWPAERVGLAAYRIMFEHSTEGVIFSTLDGTITAVNPAACATLDMAAEDICRLGLDGLVDREDPRWEIALAERDRTGISHGVARLRRGDGRFADMEVTARVFPDPDGSRRVFSIVRDPTGRIAVEREIEDLERAAGRALPRRRPHGLPEPARPHPRRQPAVPARRPAGRRRPGPLRRRGQRHGAERAARASRR